MTALNRQLLREVQTLAGSGYRVVIADLVEAMEEWDLDINEVHEAILAHVYAGNLIPFPHQVRGTLTTRMSEKALEVGVSTHHYVSLANKLRA